MTDAAKIIAENTAQIGGGKTLSKRWAELAGLDGSVRPADNRPPEEIIADVAQKAGLIITNYEHI